MDGRHVMAGHLTGITYELTDRRANLTRDGGFTHTALLYDGADEYRRCLTDLARAAALDDAPLQAVLPDFGGQAAREALTGLPPDMCVEDMTEVGRNPARLIALGRSFADEHLDEPVYCAWEPTWSGRTLAEQREVGRHEALCNLAFRDRAMTILCLYDVSSLDPELITQAELTHPVVISAGRHYSSPIYLGEGSLPAGCDAPLLLPRSDVASLRFSDSLGPVREFTARHAEAAGVASGRVRDLILAVSEIAANAHRYAAGGVIRAWRRSGEIVCQIEDTGYISDPLAGRRQRPADALGGHGLWLVNLVCDLVERRSSPAGTVTRLHMRAG